MAELEVEHEPVTEPDNSLAVEALPAQLSETVVGLEVEPDLEEEY